MEIFTSFRSLGLSKDDIKNGRYEKAISDVFDVLSDSFEEASGDTGAYLSDNQDQEKYRFGAIEPEYIKATAITWLDAIKNEFLGALDGLTTEHGKIPTANELPVDDSKTHRVSIAARELDNVWSPYGNHGVYLDNESGYPYFTVQLSKSNLADILENPDDYIVVSAFVRD